MDPQQAFAELGRIRLGETDAGGVLQRIAELARDSIPGAAEVSVTLIRDGSAHTAVFTGERARELDEFQYDNERGPCLDAATAGSTFVIADMDDEWRWPSYAKRAIDAEVRSSMAVGLPIQESVTGALNLYAAERGAFDPGAVETAKDFAGYAAVALANATSYEDTATLARQMREAMERRAVIEQAKGIIMAERHCSADKAFGILSRVSQDTHRKLRDLAADLVAEASAPPPGQ